jgi:hypothetical protein
MDHCLSLLILACAKQVFLTVLSKRLRLGESLKGRERSWVCSGPYTLRGHSALKKEF